MLPSHTQLLLPLLDVLREAGSALRPAEAAERVADRMGLAEAVRAASVSVKSYNGCNALRRRLRWVRQSAVEAGLIGGVKRGLWELTTKGTLWRIRPGLVLTVYETPSGTALWADASAAAGVIADRSVQLVFTSPPYPLQTPREYGNGAPCEESYLDWLCELARGWQRMLADDGSLVLNLRDVWVGGSPHQSLYQERLLLRLCSEFDFRLAQRVIWENPAAIPSSHWVTVRRVRIKQSHEHCFWLTKNRTAYANNREVLVPYGETMKRVLARGRGDVRRVRPSGHGDCRTAFSRDHGGSIPGSVLRVSNSASRSAYHDGCRQLGLPLHPAAFPLELPRFFIRMLTRPGDLVADPNCE